MFCPLPRRRVLIAFFRVVCLSFHFIFMIRRRYDNFRFVEHRRLKYGDAEALALSALAEVPDQYRAIQALGIMGGAQFLLCRNEWEGAGGGLGS